MKLFVFLLIFVLLPFAAYAQVTEEMLDKTYQNCLGSDNDANRAEYCSCVRDGMRRWGMEDFGEVAGQIAASKDPNMPPDKLAALAKSCIAKVLH